MKISTTKFTAAFSKFTLLTILAIFANSCLANAEPSARSASNIGVLDVEDIINYDPRIAINAVLVDSTDQGIRIEADIVYIPFNVNERMTFDFDRSNSIIR